MLLGKRLGRIGEKDWDPTLSRTHQGVKAAIRKYPRNNSIKTIDHNSYSYLYTFRFCFPPLLPLVSVIKLNTHLIPSLPSSDACK